MRYKIITIQFKFAIVIKLYIKGDYLYKLNL